MSNIPSYLNILFPIVILPALLVAWFLAGWLTARPTSWTKKLLLAAMVCLLVFLLSSLGVVTLFWDKASIQSYFATILLYTLPLMAGAAALLFSGGVAVRLRNSRARFILGWAMIVIGTMLWIVAVLIQPMLVMLMTQ